MNMKEYDRVQFLLYPVPTKNKEWHRKQIEERNSVLWGVCLAARFIPENVFVENIYLWSII